jgi:hypothetical protein
LPLNLKKVALILTSNFEGFRAKTFPTPRKVTNKGMYEILLGTPDVFKIHSGVPKFGKALTDPIGIHTHLGSTISEPTWQSEEEEEVLVLQNTVLMNPEFINHNNQMDLTKMFTLDVLGIEDPEVNQMTASKAEAIKMVDAGTTYNPDLRYYETSLL